MPGKAPRQKGNRFECELVNELRAAGLDAHRIPLSGSMRGFKGDVQIRLGGRTLTLEAKSRASGFAFIYKAIQEADILAIKVDRNEPLVVMRLSDAAAILGAKEATQEAPARTIPMIASLPRGYTDHKHLKTKTNGKALDYDDVEDVKSTGC